MKHDIKDAQKNFKQQFVNENVRGKSVSNIKFKKMMPILVKRNLSKTSLFGGSHILLKPGK